MGQAALKKCNSYMKEEVKTAITEVIELLGGIGKWVKPGSKVLIKPNILSARSPDAAVTTHPEIVRAVIELVQKAGGIASVGDSSGGVIVGSSPTARSLTVSGIEKVCQETGSQCINFDSFGVETVKLSHACFLQEIYVARPVLEADLIINLPKLKTHTATTFSGALKNTFGVVPGASKIRYHSMAPSLPDFVDVLLDIYEMVHPTLSIMDAVVGMEGNGPAHGLPRHIGAIIAAENGLDVDLTACRLINLNYNRVRLLNRALERKVGNADLEIIGDSLQDLLVKDFKLPGNAYLEIIPPFLTRYFLDKIRSYPSCTSEKCIACGMCRDSCPASAININDDCNGITINPTICIQCMCCQELCPEGAIMLKPTSLLGKLAARLGGRL